MSSHAKIFGSHVRVVFRKAVEPGRDKGNRSFAWGLKFSNPVPFLSVFCFHIHQDLIIWYLSTLLIHQDLSTLLPLWRCWVPCLTHRDSLCPLKLSKNTHILQLHHRKQTRNARSGQRSQKGEVLDTDPKWWKERSNLSSNPYIHVCLSMYIFVCT